MIFSKVFAVTIQGANHIKAAKECQDYSLALNISPKEVETFVGKESCPLMEKQQAFKKKKPVCCMAIVADGHGGDEYFRSAKGSQFAVESTKVCIAEFLRITRGKPIEKEIKQLVQSIIKRWNDMVEGDVNIRAFENSELAHLPENIQKKYHSDENRRKAYGTTLIASVLRDDYWFGFHIGDGRCTVLNQDGTFTQPIEWDDRCFLNVTTSICDDDASERARIYISENREPIPVGIFLCSDGIDDSYPVNDNEKYLAKFYRTLALNFLEKDFYDAYKEIQETLPILSEKGSGDDMSIAGIIDIDFLKKIEPKLREQISSEKIEKEKTEALANRETKIENCLDLIDEKSKMPEYGQFIDKVSVSSGKNIGIKI